MRWEAWPLHSMRHAAGCWLLAARGQRYQYDREEARSNEKRGSGPAQTTAATQQRQFCRAGMLLAGIRYSVFGIRVFYRKCGMISLAQEVRVRCSLFACSLADSWFEVRGSRFECCSSVGCGCGCGFGFRKVSSWFGSVWILLLPPNQSRAKFARPFAPQRQYIAVTRHSPAFCMERVLRVLRLKHVPIFQQLCIEEALFYNTSSNW